jgi:hypothetical protein
MSFRVYGLLFLLGLGVALIPAALERTPGYMDAEYYFAGGRQLATGHGFNEPFLWNYLGDPAGIPHPSHAYWMPLASLLAAAGMLVSGVTDFSAARIPFLLLAGLIPPTTAALAYSLTPKKDLAILAGLLAAFSAFYPPFLPTTDTFASCMLLGGLFFLLLSPGSPIPSPLITLLLGLLAAFLHLSRADGLLWLSIALIAAIYLSRRSLTTHYAPRTTDHPTRITDNASRITFHASRFAPLASRLTPHVSRITHYVVRNASFVLLSYFLLMGPWMLRNFSVFGTPLSPGGLRSLWLTNYDELFSYPASILTFDHWIDSGLKSILQARAWALGLNLQTVLAVQGEIFLLPLVIAGAWRLRKDPRVKLGVLAWLGIFLAMTVVFPFSGARGGLFHSGAALQPVWWALAPVGLERFVDFGVEKRGWRTDQARKVFSWGLVALALFLTIVVGYLRIVGNDDSGLAWNQTPRQYSKIEASLTEHGVAKGEIVMVNNPPGYFVATGRPAIVVPNGDIHSTLAAAQRYDASYLILESNHPQGLNDLYQNPIDLPGLDYLYSLENTHIFKLANIP